MAKNLINGSNVVIEENGNNINMNLSNELLTKINKIPTFSETEHIIGIWINGKPIYEKTITATLPNTENSWTNIYNNITTNIDTLVDIFGTIFNDSRYTKIPVGEGSYFINLAIQNNNLLCSRIGWASIPATITVRYTKTND